jgi:ribosomal protein S18 acetylase RimI-like enzyme
LGDLPPPPGPPLPVDLFHPPGQDEPYRLGAQLLEEARHIAIEKGCGLLRLSTGLQNEGAMRFYEREGWQRKSVTYKQKV